jgi:hypothetical protein
MKAKKSTFLQVLSGLRVPGIILTCMLFISSFIYAQDTKTDFSGSWKLNEGKSQIGEGRGRMAASKMKITQDATSLSNEKTSVRQSGEEVTTIEKVTFDGKEYDNSANNRKRKSIASWSADGKALTINSVTTFERDGNSMEIKSVDVYKTGSDNTLIVESSSSSSRGDFKATLTYEKAK